MRVVSFSLYVPYEGIEHAGGEYYLRHLRALQDAGHRVVVVAPDYPENRAGLKRSSLEVDIVLVSGGGPKILGLVDRFNRFVRVSLPQERFIRNVCKDDRVGEAVAAADLLEFQWTQSAAILGRLPKEWRRGLPAVTIAHDVLTEKYSREALDPRITWLRRIFARAKLTLIRFDERHMLAPMDEVIAFSEKDVSNLRGLLGTGAGISVIHPPLGLSDLELGLTRSPEPFTVLMVGAFYRPENAQGARWFLEEVWPRVQSAVPEATLHLVGQGPSAQMLAAAARNESVVVSGYVEDLSAYYQMAAVAVVPVLAGAGVKFKTVMAMLWGVPVVSTGIGAEGIVPRGAESRYFVAVEEDPVKFGSAVVGALLDRQPAEQVAEAAKRFAQQQFGPERFGETLNGKYRWLVASKRSS